MGGLVTPDLAQAVERAAATGDSKVFNGQLQAAWRTQESAREAPLLADEFAGCLTRESPEQDGGDTLAAARYIVQASYIDETVLRAAELHHNTRGDYSQVVLIGDALDTRPFRLPWPTGTVVYLVGAQALLDDAEARLKQRAARVPRGSMLVRVGADVAALTDALSSQLQRIGFRGDRPSVWVIQGGDVPELSQTELQTALLEITSCAGFGSIVLGELPCLTRVEANNLLAEFGLLGTLTAVQEEGRARGRWQDAWDVGPEEPQRWLFTSQHQRMSLREMAIHDEHVEAAEAVDEDFFGNFS